MGSRSHISKASVHIFHTFVFLDVLAEWTMALLNVGELVLVLQEELAALLAHGNGHVGHHVLVELARQVGAKLGVIHDVNLLIPHVLHDSLVNLDRLGAVWVHLRLELFQHLLSEQVVLHVVILIIVECQRLLLAAYSIVLPTIIMTSASLLLGRLHSSKSCSIFWWIHAEALQNSLVIKMSRWDELHER